MKRSDFIKLLGVGAAGMLLGAVRHRHVTSRKVLVVGAGIAGIAAARALRDAGHEVVVIEARDRIGGRIWTDTSLGTPIDLGASWIHQSKTNPLTSIVAQHKITVKPTDYSSYYLYDSDGKPLPDGDRESHFAQAEKVIRKAGKVATKAELGMNMQQAIDSILTGQSLEEPVSQTLAWRLAMLELYHGAELDLLSAGDLLAESANEDLLLVNGFSKLLEKLAVGLDIRLGQRVHVVRQADSGVTVSTGGEDFEGDFALITLPLGVLKDGGIRFDPVLSTSKRNAIKKIGVGHINKLALKFDKAFWTPDRHFIGYVSKRKGEFPLFLDWAHVTGKPYLIAMLGNAFSRGIERQEDMELAVMAHQVLYKLYDNASMPQKVLLSHWGSEPYSRGAYSYLPAGVELVNRDYLAQPEKRLFFAGEHAIREDAGTVHGAYLSGLRSAKWIMER